ADRGRRCDYARRKASGFRRRKLFHPRRHRGGAEKRRDPSRVLDLAPLLIQRARLTFTLPLLLLVPRQGGFFFVVRILNKDSIFFGRARRKNAGEREQRQQREFQMN